MEETFSPKVDHVYSTEKLTGWQQMEMETEIRTNKRKKK
jgi:hypothetical protein